MVVRKILETTLTAGQTSVHFTDSDIPLSLIRVYTSDPDLLPIERTLSGNTVTVYFEEQTSNVGVALEIVKAGLDIIDDLTSTDVTAALSAKQGKVLKDAIDGIVIPTVNDGELTIQKNGATVATFTANQSTGTTANISVPTTAADLAYMNTTSGLTADDVQEAIDEIVDVQSTFADKTYNKDYLRSKNLIQPELEYTNSTHNYFMTSNNVLVNPGTYTASFFNGSENNSRLLVNKVVGGIDTTIANVTVNANSRGSASVTLTEDTYLKIVGRFDPTSVISDLSVFSQIQLEEGTLTDYIPYVYSNVELKAMIDALS